MPIWMERNAERILVERIAERQPQETVEDLVAIGLCVLKKFDKIYIWEAANDGKEVSFSEYKRIAGNFSERDIQEIQSVAQRALAQYVQNHLATQVNVGVGQIIDFLPREKGWAYGFWQSFWATAAWSSIILVCFLIARYLGSDLYTYIWIPLSNVY